MKSLVAFIILIASSCAWSATSDVSIYQLHIGLTNQDNKEIGLDVYRGQSTLITMFYGSCPNVCPLLIETLRSIDSSLDDKQRSRLRVILVTIDPERDTPAVLAELATNRRIDLSRWTLARASANDIRKLAAVLNIQYRKLPNGDYNHSTIITLLDATGKTIATTSRLGKVDDEFLKQVRALTGN